MNRLIAIALFISTVFFACCGAFAYSNYEPASVPAMAESPRSWLFLIGSAACFGGACLLWWMGRVDGGQPLALGDPKRDPNKVAGGGLPKPLA